MIEIFVFLFLFLLFGYWTIEPRKNKDIETIAIKVITGMVSLYFFICLYGSLFS